MQGTISTKILGVNTRFFVQYHQSPEKHNKKTLAIGAGMWYNIRYIVNIPMN